MPCTWSTSQCVAHHRSRVLLLLLLPCMPATVGSQVEAGLAKASACITACHNACRHTTAANRSRCTSVTCMQRVHTPPDQGVCNPHLPTQRLQTQEADSPKYSCLLVNLICQPDKLVACDYHKTNKYYPAHANSNSTRLACCKPAQQGNSDTQLQICLRNI
jgi:hypothetical protein